MKAIVIQHPGGPEQLNYTEVPTPNVKEGWSLVKVMGFGINHSEIFTRQGLSPSVKFPRILGIECVGIVEKSTSMHLQPGHKVISIMGEMGRDFDGSYAEYVLLPNEQIYPITSDLPWDTLATIPETYYTAYGSLLNLKVENSESILVRGATSGVGIAFLRLIKGQFPNIHVTGTTRNLNKQPLLLDAGFDAVIEDKDNVLLTNNSYNKILELIGPASIKNSFNHLNEGGIVCSTGQLGGQWYLKDFDPIFDIKANSYLTSFYSDNVDGNKLNQLLQFIEHFNIEIKPEKVFALSETPDAHRYLEANHSFGKVIVLND